ncbi:hypothetical protein GCG54_00011447 [Colletotrichum gloeosporioides]|uniref:GPI anchored serine-threonine rich protein n=1 Tax=Colletotrichum gloeosporioides TaxID=474922 RepID=A0A8H4CSW9_COLGL|nr:uncharacterized protein GCG54_00011447 [Colletotrichum gloeosporioides]KAF3809251.1 hypothetical protein GCG54_00011447 [Colletotrichum gloeosporioides]
MQFFLPITLLIAAVAAQDTKCAAEPIVETCLSSETAKVEACSATDYDCQCAAYQAVATCYNNCPNDARASSAQNQVTIFCQQASLYGSAAQRKTASVASGSATAAVASNSATATPTTGSSASATASVSATSTPNLGVGQLARNTGGVLLAVAGVVAAVL